MTQHLDNNCEFKGKECPHAKCNNIVPKKFLEYHTSKLCLWRPQACPCCGTRKEGLSDGTPISSDRVSTFSIIKSFFSSTLTYHGIITGHHHKCPDWPARCPNSCDPYLTLTRSTVDTHVTKECPETLVDCKFAEVGCPVRRKRKDMSGYMKDALSDHVTAMFEDHMKLKRENEELKRALKRSQTGNSRFVSMECRVRVKCKVLADHESNSRSSNHLTLMMKEHLALKESVRQLREENASLRLE